MKKLFCMLIVAMVTPLLGGCLNDIGNFGSSAAPPSALTATAGDGRVMVTWTATPGVEYWIFSATDPSLTAFKWLGLANSHGYISVATPFYMCGLFSGTPYYFAANGRISGGPGGASSPTVSATPYNAASAVWATSSTTPSIPNLYGVGYTSLTTCSNNATSATGSFAAVGAGGAIFTSTDGKTWTNPTLPNGFLSDLYAVTGYAANLNNPTTPALHWVAVGAGGASVYSLDGITWATGNPYNAASPALRSLTRVAGTFFAVGDAGTILSSTDGMAAWTAQTSNTTNNLRGVTHGSIYVAVGDSGTILTSGNGINWTPQTSVTASNLQQVTSIGSIIVAVGNSGTIVTSKDAGASWTAQTISGGTPSLVGVTAESQFVINAVADPLLGFTNAQFVALDSAGKSYTSTDGLTWLAGPVSGISASNLGQPLVSSGFGYVAVGNAGASAHAF